MFCGIIEQTSLLSRGDIIALRQYQSAQQDLRKKPVFSYKKTGGFDTSPDVTEFLIETLDAQNGSIKESLTLAGGHLPFSPFSHPVTQQVMKYYYPGGQANRVPTVQVLGSMDEEITLTGKLWATRIQDVSRRREPLIISNILERLVREGNVCRFTLGDWIKYGVLLEYNPEYTNDAALGYRIRLMVIGDKNPITGEEISGEEDTVARVFGTDTAQDFSQVAQEITNELLAEKADLEGTGYIPRINVSPFSISGYLSRLVEGTPVGDIIDFGRSVYDGWVDIITTIDTVTTSAVNFSEQVERTAEDLQRQILLITSQISKIYAIQENLFVAVSKVDSSIDTFSRLLAWNTIGNLVSYTHRLQGNFSDLKKSTEREEIRNFREIYFTKGGDTLQSISAKFFGNSDRWEELGQINDIPVGDVLQEDTFLVIPN